MGKPIAQPRHRATARNGSIRMYLPSDHPVHGYKTMIGIEKQRQFGCPLEGAVPLKFRPFAYAHG